MWGCEVWGEARCSSMSLGALMLNCKNEGLQQLGDCITHPTTQMKLQSLPHLQLTPVLPLRWDVRFPQMGCTLPSDGMYAPLRWDVRFPQMGCTLPSDGMYAPLRWDVLQTSSPLE